MTFNLLKIKSFKYFLFGLVFLAFAFGIATFAYSNLNPVSKTNQEIAKVTKGNIRVSFNLDGVTEIDKRSLKFNLSGKIANIAVKEGQEVKKWQYLGNLDTGDVLKNLQKSLKDYLLARNSFEQTTKTTYPNGPENDTIKRLLENNQYNLDKSVLDVELKDISYKEALLNSPIDGIVSAINYKEGEIFNTQNSQPVIIVTVPNSAKFVVQAEDAERLKLQPNQTVSIKLDSLSGTTFKGTIDFVSNLATIDQNGLSTYKVVAVFDDYRNLDIVDGLTGEISVTTKEKNNVLQLPVAAIVRKNNQSYVNIDVSGKPQLQEVVTGFTDGKFVEIVSGVEEGTSVLIP